MSDSLDELLTQLSSGDMVAAGQLFLAFEPYLRKAVRGHFPPNLRSKFDSADILQSVWADVLRGFRKAGWRFTDADHLRGFLFVATRNRLVDRIRKHQKTVELEAPFSEETESSYLPTRQASQSEVAYAVDLWERILARCAPEHRRIVDLKSQGHSLSEIAEQTGLHPDSVRRVLRILARKVAFEG
jgi:RNA polymerase sigma-70 factor (ECF subfamily)